MWTLSGFADEIDPDPTRQVELLNALGVRHLELRSAWNVNVLDLDEGHRRELRRVLDEAGVAVSSIGSPVGKIPIDADVEPELDRLEHCLRVADEFEAPFVRLFSFFIAADDDPDDHRDEVVRRMRLFAGAARGRGVTLLHENEKDIFGDVPRRCHDLITAVDDPVLRSTWDPANFVQVGVDRPFDEGYALLRPLIPYLQVKDAHRADGRVCAAGEGDGQVRETVRALHADGFDGFVSLEPHLGEQNAFGGFSGPDAWTHAHRALTGMLSEEGIGFA